MNRDIGLRVLLALGIAALAMGCNDGDVTSVAVGPGTLRVNLATPNSGLDGAAVVILAGPAAPRSVTPIPGIVLWGGPVQTAQATVALTGTLSAGTVLTLEVDAVEQVAQYTATLREVSLADSTVALRDLTGYALTVVR